MKAALENGVDSIEHGAKMDEETVRLYKERGAFLCTTISPVPPDTAGLPERPMTRRGPIAAARGAPGRFAVGIHGAPL